MAERITEIGPASLVKGEIEAQEDVAVFGRVEGVIRSTETVTIEEDGLVDGEIEAASVVVAGVMVGNIRATTMVSILETGAVQGDIVTPSIVLLDGGAVKGRLVMDDSDPEPVKVASPASRRTGASRVTSNVGSSQRTSSRTGSRTSTQTRGRSSDSTARDTKTSRPSTQTRRSAVSNDEPLLSGDHGGDEPIEDND